jgi:hypothetical protein
MTLADLAAIRAELANCRRRIDGALGRSLQLVDLLETEWCERQRDSRLTATERSTLGTP